MSIPPSRHDARRKKALLDVTASTGLPSRSGHWRRLRRSTEQFLLDLLSGPPAFQFGSGAYRHVFQDRLRLDAIGPVPFHRFADQLGNRSIHVPGVSLELGVSLSRDMNRY